MFPVRVAELLFPWRQCRAFHDPRRIILPGTIALSPLRSPHPMDSTITEVSRETPPDPLASRLKLFEVHRARLPNGHRSILAVKRRGNTGPGSALLDKATGEDRFLTAFSHDR